MFFKKELRTAGLLVVRDNKLLLAYSNNKQAWYLPGGKVDPGETSEEALIRESKEELGVDLDAAKITYFKHVSAEAYGEEGLMMEQDCFLYPLQEEISPNAEIGALKYFSLEAYKQEPVQVIGVIIAFENLIEHGLIQ